MYVLIHASIVFEKVERFLLGFLRRFLVVGDVDLQIIALADALGQEALREVDFLHLIAEQQHGEVVLKAVEICRDHCASPSSALML